MVDHDSHFLFFSDRHIFSASRLTQCMFFLSSSVSPLPSFKINSLTDMPLPFGDSGEGEAVAAETRFRLAFLNDFVFTKEGIIALSTK